METKISLIVIVTLTVVAGFQVSNKENIPRNSYPVRVGYVDRVGQFYPVERLASSLGVPGFSDQKIYNYILLGFWKCGDLPTQAAGVWAKPIDYFGDDSVFGKTKSEIQANLRQRYNNGKSHILVSAFGPKQMPTSLGLSPLDCANKLATFVLDNNLDGCDVNWQDSASLKSGKGYEWLLIFHNHLKALIPTSIITHSPSASYFRSQDYLDRSYTQLNQKINKSVNFYNVQFYNLGTSKFNTCEELFTQSMGNFTKTSVKEINERGVDLNKIVVGKPVTPSDSTGSGYMDFQLISQCADSAYQNMKWFAGLALWQYSSDFKGKAMVTAATHLKELCQQNKDCK